MLSCLALLILPVVYLATLGLVLAVGGILLHTWREVGKAGTTGGVVFVFIVALLVLAVLLLFLLKPVFLGRRRDARPHLLSPADEPLLFAYVRKLCHLVGVPSPRSIGVECDSNASAGFQPGLLSMLRGSAHLTIGLALVRALDLGQFTGVLAHELAHLSQGFGMRLSMVIRTVSTALARIVYEPDSWDLRFAQWERSTASAMARLLLGAIGVGTSVARTTLSLQLRLCMLPVSYLGRQMERDADRVMIQVAGSAEGAGALLRSLELGVIDPAVRRALEHAWVQRRLPDDLPAFYLSHWELLGEEAQEEVREELRSHRSGPFESHPDLPDRLRAAGAEEEPGLIRDRRPAGILFNDLDELCLLTTASSYRHILGHGFTERNLASEAEIVEEQSVQVDNSGAFERVYQDGLGPCVFLDLDGLAVPKTSSEAVTRLRRARARMWKTRVNARAGHDAYVEALDRVDAAVLDRALSTRMGTRPWDLPDELEYGEEDAREDRAGVEAYASLAAERIWCAMHLLRHPQIAEKIPDAAARHERCRNLVGTLSVLAAAGARVEELRGLLVRSVGLEQVIRSESAPTKRLIDYSKETTRELRQSLRDLGKALGDHAYPFPHAEGRITLGAYAVPRIPRPREDLDVLRSAAAGAGDLINLFFHRILSELAAAVEDVESALGLGPRPGPVPPG